MSASAVLRRRLATQLREIRLAAGLSQDHLAEAMDVSLRTVMRAEGAETTLKAADLARFLEVCGADRETRDRLVELGQQARKRGGWWSAYRDLLPGPYVQLEAEATAVRTYQPLLVPGLLQTERYARALLTTVPTDSPENIERHVEAKLARQERVRSGDLAMHAVIDESALARIGDDDLAREQLKHLQALAKLPNVTLLAVPWTAGLYPAAGLAFVVLSFAAAIDPDVAMAETIGGERYFDDAEEVAVMNARFTDIERLADDVAVKISARLGKLGP